MSLFQEKAVSVALLRGIDKELGYLLPSEFADSLVCGSIVKVPLRGGVANAIVMSVCDVAELDPSFKYRPILSLVQPEPALTDDLLKVAEWMRDYYGCGLQSIFEAMIPAVVRAGKGELEVKHVCLSKDFSDEHLKKLRARAPAQAKICQILGDCGGDMPLAALLKMSGATSSAVTALEKKGLVETGKSAVTRDALADELAQAEMVSGTDFPLNEHQSAAFADIMGDVEKAKFSARLLYGVTGSGKTEIYIRAMKEVLAKGGSCIFLVPEISLTPQTVGRLRSRLGEKLVVWHSGLSEGQRLDAWRSLARGDAKIVVGARSCVFAPMKNLRLIIVDEEHDGAYKQDNVPRYNARDVAVLRAKFADAACVLGSATPALETLFNVENKKFSVSKISQRVDNRKMPLVFITDMTREKSGTVLSRILMDKIAQRLDRREQVILFLNRRGYSKIFECPDCGYVAECPHCSVSMAWHRKEDIVKCHICGHVERAPVVCPECGSQKARWRGHGTQKVEDIVSKAFPSARVGRMDRDAMRKRDNYRKILGDFRAGKLDILIGTQMIAKGLDFPRVTLVGVVDADTALHIPDFRAAERTYQLIVQVAGRAGRGTEEGEVIVQTRSPEASPIQYAKKDDLQSFLEEELQTRKKYGYPPSARLIRHIFRARDERRLAARAELWAKHAQKEFADICQIKGPAPAPIERTEDYYRWHIWYFCKSPKKVVARIASLRKKLPKDEEVEEVVDVDPVSLM